jgi:biopolymer transport protein ExbD
MKLKMRNKVTPEFTMAAMTDFVFQLLIIFMLISTLATETNSHMMDINLPTASIKTTDLSSVVVSVTPDLKYGVNGEETPKDQLVAKLKTVMPNAEPKPTIQLAIDEMAPHKVFVELVDIICVQNKELGWKIGVQTKEIAK